MDNYFTDEELYFYSDDFSDEQWELIQNLFDIHPQEGCECTEIMVHSYEVCYQKG